MKENQHESGAHALLKLGTKRENDNDNEAAQNNHINDAVEAAVMKYVGGTLGSHDSKKKRKHDADDYAFAQWTGFLDDNFMNEVPSAAVAPPSTPSKKKKKKDKKKEKKKDKEKKKNKEKKKEKKKDKKDKKDKKKKKKHRHRDHDEHAKNEEGAEQGDELTRHIEVEDGAVKENADTGYAADRNTVEKSTEERNINVRNVDQGNTHAGPTVEEKNQFHDIDEAQSKLIEAAIQNAHGLTHELNEAQEQRILEAANEVVASESFLNNDITLPNMGSQSNFSFTLNTFPVPVTATQDETKTRKRDIPKEPHKLPEYDFSTLSDVQTLTKDIYKKTLEWYNQNVKPEDRKKPRAFSPEEESYLDYYLAGYCHLTKMNREDLCQRVWASGVIKDGFWRNIYKVFSYRSVSSVYKHVRRKFHIFDVRAKWTKSDDEQLKQLTLTYPSKWTQIGELMGRMPEDCRDRYRNYLVVGENRKKSNWTQDEVDKLMAIVDEQLAVVSTVNWTLVAEKMGTRSRIQCRYKWNRMKGINQDK